MKNVLFACCWIVLVFRTSVLLSNEASKIKSVFVTDIKKTELFDVYSYPAKLTSEKQSYILAQNQGRVEKIFKKIGEPVAKDEIVLTIKHDDPAFDYRPQKIISPIGGVVAASTVEEGSKVSVGDKLGLIIDPSKIKITVEITLKDINVIKVGTVGKLSSPDTGLEVDAVVTHLSPMIDPLTGTAAAQLKIDRPENFKIGTVGVVTFKANARSGFELPKDAIVYLGKKTFIRHVDKKNIINRVEVEIKPRSSSAVEVIKGVTEGQRVVIKSSGFLQDGAVVKIEEGQKEVK
ncbi:MAG: hypothetical protein A2381_00065 [Bdellovibrionales bacterium RIFOXYB1_FULL_37_110]|nr:MAG: hypothetical protein A2181_06075 [Bdellovibrionales bacterium RIFOXYA1_FULL_38_20]OFZ49280.1 MAG: hypothetical protein A2417_17250 [Bdellovibrionales bacterium RIFOXYC1_FULL_37_79]OFZ57741.1 MAG: hypothetical protein A2381_00065 [Bdellovibrionales bacterium RIFOXYB1_FULL_37_110]OFZ61541.1 MAG: hypothetical protein A2577_00530 [Bdellovibrionales bacterium RIFOXYD1_FULL_36_51]